MTFRWWLGAGLLVMWLGTRVPVAEGLRRQAQVAVVYQDFARLPLSVAENVGLFGRERRGGPGVARAGR